MTIQPHDYARLSALSSFGLALASNSGDVLVGFLHPVSRKDRPLVLDDHHFAGAILYAMTRSNGAITAVTFHLVGSSSGSGTATLRDDGDWQIPALRLRRGATTIFATAHTADGNSSQARIDVLIPATN
ncbi:MAG TPA: hypothetical protein VHX44_07385 [Planctomycetota bacterium]|jgi:hypothetical protein|nr:hypothetical protein [Planctomycetota bacterium]